MTVATDHDAQVDGATQSLVSHLTELRARLLRALLAVLVLFFPLYYVANELYAFLAAPLLKTMPAGAPGMIATQVASPFLAPFRLAIVCAFLLAMPFVLHQFWAFVAPGLYRREKRFAVPLLISSVLLFYSGMAFAYFVVFPLAFAFFAAVVPEGVAIATDIAAYLDFVLKLLFAFGCAFEIPIATCLLVLTGLTDLTGLRAKRAYVVVGCFVIGMLLTPPDIISQILLALPMWALYEAGILCARFVSQGRSETGV